MRGFSAEDKEAYQEIMASRCYLQKKQLHEAAGLAPLKLGEIIDHFEWKWTGRAMKQERAIYRSM